MRKRTWLILIAVIIVGVAGYFIYNGVRQNQQSNSQYQTVTLARGELTSIVGATGTVRARQTALISWSTSGQIANIAAEVGQKVSGGEVLASLDQGSLPRMSSLPLLTL